MDSLTLAHAVRIAGKPEYVKHASAQPEYCFDSREATFVSCIAAHIKQASADETKTCADHARLWGISEDVERGIAQIKTATAERELNENDFALVATANGERVLKYAAYDAESTVTSAIALYDNRTAYPYPWRKLAASRILARAERFGATLPAYVDAYMHKAAGLGVATAEAIEDVRTEREQLCPREHAEAFEKVAQLLDLMYETPALRYDFGFVKSAIAALDRFDIETGIAKHASLMPEDLISADHTADKLVKAAGYSKRIVRLINGAEVDTNTLTKEALAAVDGSLAGLDPDELSEVLPTLPKTDADLLVRLAG